MQIMKLDNVNFKQRFSSKNISTLRNAFEKKIKQYPKDYEYIKTLGKAINLPTSELYRLNSIIGAEELETILRGIDRSNFVSPENVPAKQLNKKEISQLAEAGFHVNLHMHTTNSDGKMTIGSLLKQSAEYSNVAKPFGQAYNFIIAITDHDTTDGAKKALKLIAKNPEKYKNLGVVLGAELSSAFKDTEMLAKPRSYELVAYSINPFENKMNKQLAVLRQNRKTLSKQIISEANELYPQYNFSYKEACQESKNPKKGIDGFLYSLAEYLHKKSKGIDGIREISLKYLPKIKTKKDKISNSTESIFANIGKFGFLGVAHPGKIYLGGGRISEDFIKKCKEQDKSAGKVLMERFFDYLKQLGKDRFKAVEINYQAYEGSLGDAQAVLNGRAKTNNDVMGSINWLKNFIEFAKKHKLLSTGGLDTHSENPFLKH